MTGWIILAVYILGIAATIWIMCKTKQREADKYNSIERVSLGDVIQAGLVSLLSWITFLVVLFNEYEDEYVLEFKPKNKN